MSQWIMSKQLLAEITSVESQAFERATKRVMAEYREKSEALLLEQVLVALCSPRGRMNPREELIMPVPVFITEGQYDNPA